MPPDRRTIDPDHRPGSFGDQLQLCNLARAHRAPLSAGFFSGVSGHQRTPPARFLTQGMPLSTLHRRFAFARPSPPSLPPETTVLLSPSPPPSGCPRPPAFVIVV